MNEFTKAEFTVESDTWNTLWLIQKAINEGRKNKLPVKIEIKSGSVESTITVVAAVSAIGSFLLKIIEYVKRKKERDKPIKVTRVNRDAAYAFAIHHLRAEANAPQARLIIERPIDGSYFFEFEDARRTRHAYTVSQNFEIKYSREE